MGLHKGRRMREGKAGLTEIYTYIRIYTHIYIAILFLCIPLRSK